MDRRDRTRRATSAAASMAALAAAAAAGEGAENGTATAMAEDMNTPTLLTGAASGVSLTPTAAVPVSARNGPAAVAGAVEAGAGGGGGGPSCQADRCGANLADAKRYHKRHKVCETHAKAHVVIVAGRQQRFCQQCSRFHELSEFDDIKRSCRRRLTGHNERRRKYAADQHVGGGGGGSDHQGGRFPGNPPPLIR